MSDPLSLISALVGGFGILLSSPFGPATLPAADMNELRTRAVPAYAARISDADGRDLGELYREGPLSSPLALLPETFLRAVIATEDRRFFEHRGIDPVGLAGATASQFGRNPRGGSTIDQQMAKNAWTGPEVSLRRKIPEAVLALRARHQLGAEGVLQAYLETAWFGRGVTGAAGAAQAWFARDWAELSLGEIAYLAGILKGPGFYDAERHPERALARRNQVLVAMLREGFISEEAAEAARAEPIEAAPRRMAGQGAENRWFMTAARPAIGRAIEEMPAWHTLFAQVDVETTLSAEWQALAQSALAGTIRNISPLEPFAVLEAADLEEIREARDERGNLRRLARAHLSGILPWDSDAQAGLLVDRSGEDWTILLANGELRTAALSVSGNFALQPGQVLALRDEVDGFAAQGRNTIEGAVVIIDPRDGSLLASIGGADPNLTSFDRTRARRQPGSAIKTFLWIAAMQSGYHPGSPVPDFEQEYITEDGEAWRPRNYGRSQSGMVPLSSAYEQSSNLVAAALIDAIGSDAMAQVAERAGAYPDGMRRHMTAALGTMEVTLLDLTRAHGAVVNDGVPREPTVIRNMELDGHRLISDGVRVGQGRHGGGPIASRFIIEDMLGMMRNVVRHGTASGAFRGNPVTIAGKTGTTQGYRDAWFVGVTPHLAIGVWIGRDDNRSMPGRIAGGRHAAPVAARILAEAHRAGLIDGEGYRDEGRASGIAWPPGATMAVTQGGGVIIEGTAQEQPAHQSVPRYVPAPAQPAQSGGGFWGVVGEVNRPAARDDQFREPNRNADLLRDRWN